MPATTIERVERGPEAMTVAEVDGLLYLPGHARRDLTRALRIPALSEGWQGSFRELLEQAPDGEHRGAGVDRDAADARRRHRPREHDRDLGASGRRSTASRRSRRGPGSS